MTKIIFATNVDSGEPVGIEEEDLIEHRAQILANLERKILTAVCQRSDGATRSIIAAMVEYHPKSKSFTNAMSHLKSMGYIDYSDNNLIPTTQGLKEIPIVEPFPHYTEDLV